MKTFEEYWSHKEDNDFVTCTHPEDAFNEALEDMEEEPTDETVLTLYKFTPVTFNKSRFAEDIVDSVEQHLYEYYIHEEFHTNKSPLTEDMIQRIEDLVESVSKFEVLSIEPCGKVTKTVREWRELMEKLRRPEEKGESQ